MREKVNEIQISIPEELGTRVGAALGEVRRLHRKRVLRRAGAVMGSFVAVVGVMLGMAAVNPAMASQIPLVGDWLGSLFYQANYDSKVGAGGAFLETYDVLEDVSATAENGDWKITIQQGYTDGNTVQLSLILTGPQELLDRYSGVDIGDYGNNAVTAVINGEEAVVDGANPFYERDGAWSSTLTLEVPKSQKDAETLQIDLMMEALSGRVEDASAQAAAGQEQQDRLLEESDEATAGQGTGGSFINPRTDEPIQGNFSASFTLTVDREHNFSFTTEAEDNGAKVLAVSGTPTQTVITVEKPFWGYWNENVPEDGPMGYPFLILPDGTEVDQDVQKSKDVGGYDYQSTQPQTADLYFDGVPAGTQQVILRFYDSGSEKKKVLAEFTIGLKAATVTPSHSYEEGGALDLSSATRYEILQNGGRGQEQNGFTLLNVSFSNFQGVRSSSLIFELPEDSVESALGVEVYGSGDTLLWKSDSMEEDGTWNENWYFTGDPVLSREEDGSYTWQEQPPQYTVNVPFQREAVPIGIVVTVKIIDRDTGKILCTDTRTLEMVQR